MKPVIIIAIAFVLLSSTIIPTMATHEPNFLELERLECEKKYEQNVYIEGGTTEQIEKAYDFCLSLSTDPEKPLTENQCYQQHDDNIEKLERAIEIGAKSEEDRKGLESYQTQKLQICLDGAVTKKQLECYVELDVLRYHENNIAKALTNAPSTISPEYYDNALTKYNHCMGIKPDSLSKEPVYKTSEQIIKDEAHRQCEEYWQKHDQKYEACIIEHSRDIRSYITGKCDEMKPYDIEEWYLTGNTFDQWNQCQINTVAALYQSQPVTNLDIVCAQGDFKNIAGQCISEREPESVVNSDIICGTGTIEKNGQCVVDTNYKSTLKTSSKGGGCLIATATYGSELAPQVQLLREIRDNSLLQTESGIQFMSTFNDFYYSFSPVIADYERENPMFKEIVKLVITPMISSLSLMENANSESEVMSLGLSVIMLNLGMYLGVPAVLIVGIRKRI
ncbi:MAG: CFI-box-CTERM domain-containing protein [Candidatus Nitrosopumilus sp. Bin_571-38]